MRYADISIYYELTVVVRRECRGKTRYRQRIQIPGTRHSLGVTKGNFVDLKMSTKSAVDMKANR